MDNIKISVVIPFYNAREYVAQAVESALAQPQTGEVLLIEDHSPDGGLDVCRQLAKKYSKVKLIQHQDGANHGAAESRNLGIKNSTFSYIAFLDADDYYLPNRFQKTVEILCSYENADGVYEAIGATYQNEAAKELFSTLKFNEITTIREKVEPERLFEMLVNGGIGYFHLNGLTVHKRIFDKSGYFSEKLTIYEDTDLMFRISAKGLLYPGSIKSPVAIRRVHDLNRITYYQSDVRKSQKSTIILFHSLCEWGKKNLNQSQQKWLLHRYIMQLRRSDLFADANFSDFLESRLKMFCLAIGFPGLFGDPYLWRLLIPSREILRRF